MMAEEQDQVMVRAAARRMARKLVGDLGTDELDEVLRAPVEAILHPAGPLAWVTERNRRHDQIREAISGVLDDAGLQLDDLTWQEDLDDRSLTLKLSISGDFETD